MNSVITIVKESKALFLFIILSVITHTSVFLVNPTFSLSTSDEWGDSKGRFLIVELRRAVGAYGHTPLQESGVGSSEIQRLRGSDVKRVRGQKLEKGSENVASTPEKDKDNFQAGKKESPAKGISIGKPIQSSFTPRQAFDEAQAMAQGERGEVRPADDGLVMGEDIEDISAQPSEAADVHSDVSPVEQEVVQESGAVLLAGNAADQPAIFAVKEEAEKGDAVQTSEPNPHLNPLPEGEEHILFPPLQGEGQGRDGVNNELSGQNDIEVKEPERKEEGKSEVMVSEGHENQPHPHLNPLPEGEETILSPPLQGEGWGGDEVFSEGSLEGKVKDVKESEVWKQEPPTTDTSQPKSPPVEHPQDVRVAEKEKESEKIAEERVEAPVKKKKRTIPFHKVLEPERETTIGVPLGRPLVKIITPSKKKTGNRVQGISGKAQGNGITRVKLSINGEDTIVPVKNGRFHQDAVLRDGKNTISATVWDMDGYSAMDTVAVEVLPPKNAFELSIDEPSAGELESPVAMVRGRVGDATVDTVRVILNSESMEAPIEDGQFEKAILLKGRENVLEAEATNSAGLIARSGPVRVSVRNPSVPDVELHILWEDMDTEPELNLSMKDRPELGNERGVLRDVGIAELLSAKDGRGERLLALEDAREGAYTVTLSAERGTYYTLEVAIGSKRRVFEKRLLDGEVWTVGRFIMPEGVFWDEDEWFSGRIEDKDSITKYRSPEGITWKEMKVE